MRSQLSDCVSTYKIILDDISFYNAFQKAAVVIQ